MLERRIYLTGDKMKKSKMYSRGKAVGGGRSNPLSVKPKQSKMASKAKRRSKKMMGGAGVPVGSGGVQPIQMLPPKQRRIPVAPLSKPAAPISKMGGDRLGMSSGGNSKAKKSKMMSTGGNAKKSKMMSKGNMKGVKKSKMMSRGNIKGVSGKSKALGAKARKNSKGRGQVGRSLSDADLRKLKSILKGIL